VAELDDPGGVVVRLGPPQLVIEVGDHQAFGGEQRTQDSQEGDTVGPPRDGGQPALARLRAGSQEVLNRLRHRSRRGKHLAHG